MFQNVLDDKNRLKSFVITPPWCSFYTKQKFQPFLKLCSRLLQEGKIELKLPNIPRWM